jgi:2-keto-4-pentenoate hydratase/2-oxohepta-3-ene-1,7-dioic acid hydratase in catechol pathway
VSKYITLNEGDLIMTGTMDGGNTLLNGQHLEVTLKENGVTLAELNMKMDIEVIE